LGWFINLPLIKYYQDHFFFAVVRAEGKND